MADDASIERAAHRLAELLAGGGALRDPTGGELVFEQSVTIAELRPADAPSDVWAVDGGQALVADARCLQLYATRAATVRWRSGRCELEDEGQLRAHVLGLGEDRRVVAALGAPVNPDSPVDVNLLRDWEEWRAVSAAVDAAEPGGMVLVDGDLQPDWRIAASWVAALLRRATDRDVVLAGVTKHSSLARGGAPLIGALEREAEESLGPRSTWWAKVATTRPELGPGLSVCVARLDPDARFAFRVDLPGGVDPARSLGRLAGCCDDAAFPGYPYPLSVADRLAACPGWLRRDSWERVESVLVDSGIAGDVVERAFADRHRMMERG